MFKSTEPQYVYFNSHVVNTQNYSVGRTQDAIATISESRTTPIISDISQYDLSIVRFDVVGLKDLPIFIPLIEEAQPDYNKTTYKATMSVRIGDGSGGVETFEVTRNMNFIPQIGSIIPPSQPNPKPDYNNPYYYVYSFYHITKMINALFKDCYDALQTDINDNATSPFTINQEPPRIEYESTTQKFKMYFYKSGYDDDANTGVPIGPDAYFSLYFNSNLSNLLSNFRGDFKYEDNKFFKFNFSDYFLKFQKKEEINGADYLIMEQEKKNLDLFSPVANLVFTTDLIPSMSENISVSNLYTNYVEKIGNNNDTENIITDISLPVENPYDVNTVAYTPSGEYRMLNMRNTAGKQLKDINFSLKWRNKYNGSLLQVQLSPGSYFGVKILFSQKFKHSIKQ